MTTQFMTHENREPLNSISAAISKRIIGQCDVSDIREGAQHCG
jgi:hypothetical protein